MILIKQLKHAGGKNNLLNSYIIKTKTGRLYALRVYYDRIHINNLKQMEFHILPFNFYTGFPKV